MNGSSENDQPNQPADPSGSAPANTSTARLPLLVSFEQAEALAEKEQDQFYLTAFMLQYWLGDLILRARAEYAEKKDPKDRLLQTGDAWRQLQEIFQKTKDQEPDYLVSSFLRFSRSEPNPGGSLNQALSLLGIEHECSASSPSPPVEERGGERRPAKPNHPLIHESNNPPLQHSHSPAPGTSIQIPVSEPPSSPPPLSPSSLPRLCDWLDAVIHLRTHLHWHLAPICFDPDAQKRELAELGNAQRHMAKLNPHAKAYWQWQFSEAAERFKDSPKWPTVGKAMSAESDRLWPYREVDTLVISLWPLVKLHNWTYRDVLNVIRPALKRPQVYPCEREQEFATYCTNVLGLRKTKKGVSAKNGRPAGWEVAGRICRGPQS